MRSRSRDVLGALPWLVLLVLVACGSGGGSPPAAAPSYALSFDGVDDLATIAIAVLPSTTFTVEAWIRPTTLLPSSPTLAGVVVVDSVHALSLATDQTAFSYGVCVPGCNGPTSPTSTLQAGVWQHVAGVFDGSNVRIYRNGAPVGTVAHAGTAGGSSQVLVGLFNGSFDGLIDEVRVWNVARSESEILATMGSILTGSEAGLLGYWRFEETSGQTLLDATSGGNDGTLGADGLVGGDDPGRVTPGAPVS